MHTVCPVSCPHFFLLKHVLVIVLLSEPRLTTRKVTRLEKKSSPAEGNVTSRRQTADMSQSGSVRDPDRWAEAQAWERWQYWEFREADQLRGLCHLGAPASYQTGWKAGPGCQERTARCRRNPSPGQLTKTRIQNRELNNHKAIPQIFI